MSNPIVKPQFRNLLASQLKRDLTLALIASTSMAILYKIFVADKRKQRYVNFYKTYDPEKQLKIMNEAGLMQSYNITQE